MGVKHFLAAGGPGPGPAAPVQTFRHSPSPL